MQDKPTLWWSYDAENSSFTALPPGPLLFPAFIVAVIIYCFESLKDRQNRPRKALGKSFVESTEYKKMKNRCFELLEKKHNGEGLQLHEQVELDRLKRPWWISSGTWSYLD
jgi:hypothetical protein